MTYQKSLDYMLARLPMFYRIGPAAYKPDLNNTLLLCDLLGNPQNSFRSVHIAGTNGKGSVSNMLASVLQEKKLKVGLYTSPHLKDFRERIRVNGKMIPKKNVTDFIRDHKDDFERIGLSFFEMTAGLAFDHFRRENVDIAVIEVGLGGRLDSTNVVTPLLSVITNISYDHMELLGDTLEKIAAEKAGIIKPGIPVVIGETQGETKEVFRLKADAAGSPLFFADGHYNPVLRRLSNPGELIMDIYKNERLFISGVESPLGGFYQQKNIVTVVAACEELSKSGFSFSPELIKKGIRKVIRNTGFAGRWQILSRSPLTICDTGHNEGGLREVLSQIATMPFEKLHFVFGLVNDKAIGKLLGMLPKDAIYYFCKADIPRGMDAEELKREASEAGLHGKAYSSVREAVAGAQKNASAADLVFIGGSTFVVAEAI
jgi:dihydrofolate synthase/folylpolyglutamate synthase